MMEVETHSTEQDPEPLSPEQDQEPPSPADAEAEATPASAVETTMQALMSLSLIHI